MPTVFLKIEPSRIQPSHYPHSLKKEKKTLCKLSDSQGHKDVKSGLAAVIGSAPLTLPLTSAFISNIALSRITVLPDADVLLVGGVSWVSSQDNFGRIFDTFLSLLPR